MLLELLCDAGLEGALDGVTCQIESTWIGLGIEEDFRLSQALLGDALQVGSVQGLQVRF